jgi:hypothetical protein
MFVPILSVVLIVKYDDCSDSDGDIVVFGIDIAVEVTKLADIVVSRSDVTI